ncbi:divalent-cation tolerance protein CutA [Nitrosospira multiformis]|uniref:divalent-cation tolerance protein CutA n=1 Tax=Nitrosospira multiformis TaxID=1231 RepID=UPI0008941C85|nr:divalent-cation tolerance protein CutA [Nitrosospira multiformis]SEA48648.1 divalent cation tolerance protein [Nitrosospira multiformis]
MSQPLQSYTAPETGYILVVTGLPDKARAVLLAHKLIEERLAACVNIQSECTSIYRWQGKMESGVEVPVFIKTVAQHYSSVERLIKSMHPYELPEIIAVPISSGLPAYLHWISGETSNPDKN